MLLKFIDSYSKTSFKITLFEKSNLVASIAYRKLSFKITLFEKSSLVALKIRDSHRKLSFKNNTFRKISPSCFKN